MKTQVTLFEGDLTSPEGQNVLVDVDLSAFTSGVLWVRRGAGGATGSNQLTVSLLAKQDGFGYGGLTAVGGTSVGALSQNGHARLEYAALRDLEYTLQFNVPVGGGAYDVEAIFIGDDGQSSDSGGFTINLTGSVEKE